MAAGLKFESVCRRFTRSHEVAGTSEVRKKECNATGMIVYHTKSRKLSIWPLPISAARLIWLSPVMQSEALEKWQRFERDGIEKVAVERRSPLIVTHQGRGLKREEGRQSFRRSHVPDRRHRLDL